MELHIRIFERQILGVIEKPRSNPPFYFLFRKVLPIIYVSIIRHRKLLDYVFLFLVIELSTK